MPELTLLSYEGPGSIAGVPFEVITVAEHAAGYGEEVTRRWWEVTAETERPALPTPLLQQALEEGSCEVVVPGRGQAVAEAGSVAWTDDGRWRFELRGEGRAPLSAPGGA